MANLGPAPKVQFFDAVGAPLVGGKVYTYAAGTVTPLVTYTDSSGNTPNANPVVLDARGEANIWFGSGTYKLKLTTATDVEIWTVDNVSGILSAVSPALSGNVVISSDSAFAALRITQTGAGPVLRVEDSANPDTTPFIVANNGYVGIGTAAPINPLEVIGTVKATTFDGAWASIPSGTAMLFAQTAAPTGWTKSTTHNNKALRVVSGSAGSGGTVAFTSAFSATTALAGTTDAHQLLITEIPSHNHNIGVTTGTVLAGTTGVGGAVAGTSTSTNAGGTAAHSHNLSALGYVNLDVQYVDVIIAVKN